MLVGESSSDALDEDEGKIQLSVLTFESVAQSPKKLCVPDGSAGAAENVPVGFGDVDAGWVLGEILMILEGMRVSQPGSPASNCDFSRQAEIRFPVTPPSKVCFRPIIKWTISQ